MFCITWTRGIQVFCINIFVVFLWYNMVKEIRERLDLGSGFFVFLGRIKAFYIEKVLCMGIAQGVYTGCIKVAAQGMQMPMDFA